MAGEAFQAMTRGLTALLSELRSDPMALETAAISFITFASTAQQVIPLTELYTYPANQLPRLRMGSGTALGAALQLLEECLGREVLKTTADRKGDYKPVCFLLTDGEPTDQWENSAARIRNNVCGKQANVIAVGCGPDADLEKLRQITDAVVAMKNADEASFRQFFKWVSASVSSASQALGGAGEHGVSLPGLPEECMEMARPEKRRESPVPDRYVFLHARCVKTSQFFLARFAKQPAEKKGIFGGGKAIYKGVAAHVVEDFDLDPKAKDPRQNVSTEFLEAPPHCPCCQHEMLAMCRCGSVHCCPRVAQPVTLTCPWCRSTSIYGNVGAFDVGRGAG